jgi:AraC-like DNA-binding protein
MTNSYQADAEARRESRLVRERIRRWLLKPLSCAVGVKRCAQTSCREPRSNATRTSGLFRSSQLLSSNVGFARQPNGARYKDAACSGDCGEGLSFRDPGDEWRRALSLVTNTPLPLSEVSEALGYSEQGVYTEAFRCWHGGTPHRFRMQRLVEALEGESAAIICPACRRTSWQGSPASLRTRLSPAPRIALERPLP